MAISSDDRDSRVSEDLLYFLLSIRPFDTAVAQLLHVTRPA